MDALAIEALQVGVSFGSRVVLKDLSFAVRLGEFWIVLGPNGSGKSTLLRTLVGLRRPDQGSIVYGPNIADHWRLGYVTQAENTNRNLPTTVREVVGLGLATLPVSGEEPKRRIEWALSRIGLEDHAARDFSGLSVGQRQRVLIARALVRMPSLLILDEPTNHLDPESREDFLAVIERLHREEGLTVILVTHDLSIARRIGSHLLLLEAGGRYRLGTREDLLPDVPQLTVGQSNARSEKGRNEHA